MTSDKERREIARRLRAAAKTKSNNSDYLWRRLEIAVNGWKFGGAINGSYTFNNDVLARLADLCARQRSRWTSNRRTARKYTLRAGGNALGAERKPSCYTTRARLLRARTVVRRLLTMASVVMPCERRCKCCFVRCRDRVSRVLHVVLDVAAWIDWSGALDGAGVVGLGAGRLWAHRGVQGAHG